MLTVACVLRSGREYRPEHVAALRDNVAKQLSLPHRFVCLSDCEVPCERIALIHGWPSYWAKLELFRAELFDGPVVYVDLDTSILRSMDFTASAADRFTMLRDFYWHDPPASGVMAWNVERHDLTPIYRAFVAKSREWMPRPQTKGSWGDQGFIAAHTPIQPVFWQDRFPGKVVSYKVHVRRKAHPRERGDGSVPADAAVVCFHGKPRLWEVPPLAA